MKCPHCLNSIHADFNQKYIGHDVDSIWILLTYECPSCKRIVIQLGQAEQLNSSSLGAKHEIISQWMIYPKSSSRPPCPSEVPSNIADDYTEACIILPDSPKASAALSRRCLQHLIREKADVTHSSLSREIQQVIDSELLPSHLAGSIDAIRNIGNFSAHPIKNESTGEIVAVEPHEAEWTLDVLESLFDSYFVQPAKLKAKRDALNEKLADIGKPPMK